MIDMFERTQLLYGAENMEKLRRAKVAIFGIGGVGGYAAEALVRSGVGSFVLVDSDKVSLTNLNRQIIAMDTSTGETSLLVGSEEFDSLSQSSSGTAFAWQSEMLTLAESVPLMFNVPCAKIPPPSPKETVVRVSLDSTFLLPPVAWQLLSSAAPLIVTATDDEE